MKLSDKIWAGVVVLVIVAIGLCDLYLKVDKWSGCRDNHNLVYCLVTG